MNNSTARPNSSIYYQSQLDGQSTRRIDGEKVAEIAFHTFILVGGLIGNLFVACVVLRRKRMRTPTNWLVFNLAVADLVIVLYVIPLTNVIFLVRWPFGEIGCKYIFMPTSEFPAGVIVLTHTALALLRYYIVCHPLGSRLRENVVFLIIALVWAIAFLTMSATLMGPLALGEYAPQKSCVLRFKSASHRKAYRLLVFSLTYIIPMVATGYAYLKIHIAVRDNVKSIRNLISENLILHRQRQSRKMNRTLMIMYVFFACATLPIQLLFMINDFELLRVGRTLGNHLFIVLLALFYSQVISNPLVLFYMGDEFRKELYALPVCVCARGSRGRRFSDSITDSFREVKANFRDRESSTFSQITRLTRLSTRLSRRWSRMSSLSGKRRFSNADKNMNKCAPENKQDPTKLPKDCYIPLSYFTTLPGTVNEADRVAVPNIDGDNSVVSAKNVGQESVNVPNGSICTAHTHSESEILQPRLKLISLPSQPRHSVYDSISSEESGMISLNLPDFGHERSGASSVIYEETEGSLGSSTGEAVRSAEIHRTLSCGVCLLESCVHPQANRRNDRAGTLGSAVLAETEPLINMKSIVMIKDGELLIEGITRETLI